jgi:hypothetical protein
MRRMWPFTTRRIFGNRWWAVGFVVFVCWQAVEFTNDNSARSNADAAAQAEYAHSIENSLNAM